MKCAIPFLLAWLLAAMPAPADELTLKDGTKISGKIVGYEGESFKVETSYGYALVRRDKVASIKIEEDAKSEAVKAESAKKESQPASGRAELANDAQRASSAPPQPQQPTESKTAPVTAAARPAPPPPEPPMRESVEGTAYINHTYGFRMFKPPSWRVIEGAQRLLPSAIVAMGTNDQSTLLVLGRGRLTSTLDAHVSLTDRQLRQVYENYRLLSDERTVVAGVPAVERRFRGTVDERDWSCVLVAFGRGSDVFTILGMTTADSDLVQIQENVIARAVASLEFQQP